MFMFIVLAVFACFVVHEGGHFLAALCFGRRLKFELVWGRFRVPRGVWYMPDVEAWKQKTIAVWGFGAELLGALLCCLFLPVFAWRVVGVVFIHFVAYPFYAGEVSDFKWL